MKSLTILIIAASLAGISGTFTGCRKETKKACRLTGATPVPSGAPFLISYNRDGRIERVINGVSTITFDYNPGTSTNIAVTQDTGVFVNKKTITVNAAGLATHVRTENDFAGTAWTDDIYEYNGEELTRSISTSSETNTASIITFTWSNHNMISETTGSATVPFDYYQDKPRQAGDYLNLVQIVQGYEVFRTKNLLKSISGATITYGFGSDGYISSLSTGAGATSSSIFYQYDCDQ
ncbi:hypothetical protein ACX0G9_13090 [Flavitalea flava]